MYLYFYAILPFATSNDTTDSKPSIYAHYVIDTVSLLLQP